MNDMLEVTVQQRHEYGMRRIYPTNKLGKDYAERLKKKTLSLGDLDFIHNLGVKIIQDPNNGIPY